jgi:signal transduction histidine kinase
MNPLKIYLNLLLLSLPLLLWQCQNEKHIEQVDSKAKIWLDSKANYEDKKNYHAVFLKEYNKYIENKQYDEAKTLLNSFGTVVYNTYETDSVCSKTIEQFLNKNYTEEKDTTYANLYYFLAWDYFDKNDFKKSTKLAETSLEINKSRSKKNHLRANKLIGICFYNIGQPEKAIKIFTELLPLAEKEKDLKALGSLNYNIAYSYDMLNAYNESEKMYKKAAKYFLAAKDTTTYFAQQSFFAINNFDHKNDTLNTIKFIDSLVYQFQEYKKPSDIDFVGINDIKAYKSFLTKNYDSATYHNNKSTEFYRNNKNFLADYELFDNKIYFQKYKRLKDKKRLITLLDEFLVSGDNYACIEMCNMLYQNALNENNLKEAIFYRNKEIALKEDLLKLNQKGQLFEFDKKYQSTQKEQQIALQKSDLAQKNTYIVSLFAILGALISGILGYYAWQKQKRLKQENLNSMNFTKQLLETTEVERKRIATDLHDSISHELLNLKSIFKQDIGTVNTKIDSIINDIRGISRNLHPVMFDKIGLVPNIEQLVERIQTQNNFLVNTEIDYKGSLTSTDELQIYRIIQEALTNIIRYAKAHAAKISIFEKNDHILIEIKDNGKGFNVKESLNSGKAFGLHNIIERSRAIGGVAQIQSSTEGTIININIAKRISIR